MSEHLTDIQLFEYSNSILENAEELKTIKLHLDDCEACRARLAVEQQVDESIKAGLAVHKEINVAQRVLQHFEKPAVKMVGVDVSWAVMVVFFITGLLLIGELTTVNKAIPELTYTTVIASAIAALLLVDFFLKYLKYRKS